MQALQPHAAVGSQDRRPGQHRRDARRCCSADPSSAERGPQGEAAGPQPGPSRDLNKEVSRVARDLAVNFAPRASQTRGKNPAYPGSVLYSVFEAQAWLSVVAGALLSCNLVLPSDKPSIARLLGMWSIWIFTVPSLRARDCSAAEKDALNLLFLVIPLLNVTIPLVWRSFPAVFFADVATLLLVYNWKVYKWVRL